MSKSLQLSVPQPCHEDWQNMITVEQGRFCNSCKKNVIDFSLMSDGEIRRYFSTRTSSICGRFYSDQLNRNIDFPKRKTIPWLKYFFQFTLPALLVSMKLQAQKKDSIPVVEVTSCWKGTVKGKFTGVVNDPKSENVEITGKVTDNHGSRLRDVSVLIKGTRTGTFTDTNGMFKIFSPEKTETVVLAISCVGFQSVEQRINVNDQTNVVLAMAKDIFMDKIIAGVIMEIPLKKPVRRTQIQMIKSVLRIDSIKIYPNPVQSGNEINLQLKVNALGQYLAELVSIEGRTIASRQFSIENNSSLYQFSTDHIAAGFYVINIFSPKKKKIASKKILIQ